MELVEVATTLRNVRPAFSRTALLQQRCLLAIATGTLRLSAAKVRCIAFKCCLSKHRADEFKAIHAGASLRKSFHLLFLL